jgi:aromatic ring-opening dioxygenase catalytic subunit (LigB family)
MFTPEFRYHFSPDAIYISSLRRVSILSMKMPVLFVSHGAPTLPLEPGDTGAAWQKLGEQLPRPSAILMISAHWGTRIPTISRAVQPETIHDFSGFPAELYKLQYPAPGAPEMAQAAARTSQCNWMTRMASIMAHGCR